jgi:hypothetical protein
MENAQNALAELSAGGLAGPSLILNKFLDRAAVSR